MEVQEEVVAEVVKEEIIEDGRLSTLVELCTAVLCDDLLRNRMVLADQNQLPDVRYRNTTSTPPFVRTFAEEGSPFWMRTE